MFCELLEAGTLSYLSSSPRHSAGGSDVAGAPDASWYHESVASLPPSASPSGPRMIVAWTAGPPGEDVKDHFAAEDAQAPGVARSRHGGAGTRRGPAAALFSVSALHPVAPSRGLSSQPGAPRLGMRKPVNTPDPLQNCEPVCRRHHGFHQIFRADPGPKTIKSNWPGDIFFLSFPFD